MHAAVSQSPIAVVSILEQNRPSFPQFLPSSSCCCPSFETRPTGRITIAILNLGLNRECSPPRYQFRQYVFLGTSCPADLSY